MIPPIAWIFDGSAFEHGWGTDTTDKNHRGGFKSAAAIRNLLKQVLDRVDNRLESVLCISRGIHPAAQGLPWTACKTFRHTRALRPGPQLWLFFRVLRPGGRLYVLEFFRRDSLPVRFLRRVAGTLLFPLLARATGSDPGAYRYLISSMGSFLSLPQVEEVMERGGFRTIGRKSLFFGLLALWEGER